MVAGAAGVTIASALAAAELGLRETERHAEVLLSSLFPSWKGWSFTAPNGIDVYDVVDSTRAAGILHRNGFVTVTLHAHRAERFLSCSCKVHERR